MFEGKEIREIYTFNSFLIFLYRDGKLYNIIFYKDINQVEPVYKYLPTTPQIEYKGKEKIMNEPIPLDDFVDYLIDMYQSG